MINSNNKLTVACVYNSQKNTRGPDYDLDWVHKLHRAVSRNLNVDFEFVCLSNVETPYKTIPLITNSDVFWNKIELFRPELFKGPVLYLDLDVVVCKNITDQIQSLPTDKLLMVKEPYMDIVNSSVMFWQGDFSELFFNYIDNKQQVITKYASPGLRFGDQAYIYEHAQTDLIENYTSKNFVQWCHHKVPTEISDPVLLIFLSKQKPSNNLYLPQVRDHWIN